MANITVVVRYIDDFQHLNTFDNASVNQLHLPIYVSIQMSDWYLSSSNQITQGNNGKSRNVAESLCLHAL